MPKYYLYADQVPAVTALPDKEDAKPLDFCGADASIELSPEDNEDYLHDMEMYEGWQNRFRNAIKRFDAAQGKPTISFDGAEARDAAQDYIIRQDAYSTEILGDYRPILCDLTVASKEDK